MYIEKDKPQLPLMDKKDPAGVVLDAFIENDRKLQEVQGETPDTVQHIEEQKQTALDKIKAMEDRVKAKLAQHTDKKGVVHGETKVTVGLGNKDNFPMGTLEDHKAGTRDDVYAHPAGAKLLIESRVKVDPRSYIPARILPIASGGIQGDIPQWPIDYTVGDLQQSPIDPKEFFGDTPFEFSTPSGVMIYPSMNPSPVIGRYTQVPAGVDSIGQTPWGGSKIRIYNKTIDSRRTRPSFIRGWNSGQNTGDTVVASSELFDKKAVYYKEGDNRFIRSFNKNGLPFDVYNDGAGQMIKGINEYSEGYRYNLASKVINWTFPGGTDKEIFIQIDTGINSINESDFQLANGPSQPTEHYATPKVSMTTFNTTVPAHGKIKAITGGSLGIKLRDLVNVPAGIDATLYGSLNTKASEKISFCWFNRIRNLAGVKIGMGWWNKSKTKYWHAWLPLLITYTNNEATKTTTMVVATTAIWDGAKQTMDSNYDITGAGLFKEYKPTLAEDPAHPLALSGVFDPLGGHIKTFTMYNRQYVGYYEHGVTDTTSFFNLGANPFPTPTKYSYLAQPTINSDGFYGDHLRHIPIWVDVNGGFVHYLTRVRDWRNRYRWCLVKMKSDTEIAQDRKWGNFLGDFPESITWLAEGFQVPNSFLIENDDLSATMNIDCMVFNTKNNYRGYTSYTFDPNNLETPIVYTDPVTIHTEINAWVSEHGGGWSRNDKLFFYFKGNLFWFNQCVSPNEYPASGVDCYYGVIKDCYIHVAADGTKTVRSRNPIAESVIVNSVNINTKQSLQIDTGTVLGFDPQVTRDIYAMKTYHNGNDIKYDVMIPVAPFNNFYIEMKIGFNPSNKEVKIQPKLDAVDPIFPYTEERGYQIDYDTEILYGKKIPHRLHINFQSPVMLKKGMWSFRKTPNNYGFFTRRYGFITHTGGVMGSYSGGLTVFPVGSVLTIGGKNTVVKKPINFVAKNFSSQEELFVRIENGEPVLYGDNYNPNGYEIEPHNGACPAGFTAGAEFRYYDTDGWKNSLLPVVENNRMSLFGYGRTFPALMGKTGSGVPTNRFFLAEKYTLMTWDTAVGRTIPTISKRGMAIVIDGQTFYMNGAQSFTIPANFTGVKQITMAGAQTLKWAPGLVDISQFGNDITKLDFSGSTQFSISGQLPKRVTSLYRTFINATGATYPGIENWSVDHVLDFMECFANTPNFNQPLPNWRMYAARNIDGMFRGTGKFNQSLNTWTLPSVATAKYVFMGALAFNQVLTWDLMHVQTIKGMFRDTAVFNSDITGMRIPICTDASELFMGSLAYNTSIDNLKMDSVQVIDNMFENAKLFNKPINLTLKQCISAREVFQNNSVFNSALNLVMPICRDYTRMFAFNTKFNQPLPNWNFPPRTDLTEMFKNNTAFNQSLNGWMMERVRFINGLFRYSTGFTQPIDGWNLAGVVGATYVFANTNYNSPLTNWRWPTDPSLDVQVTGLFYSCPEFNQPIGDWNTEAWGFCSGFFYMAKKFNQPIGQWNMSNVKTLPNFFWGAEAFEQDISNWDTQKVQDLSQFARSALKFKSDVSRWKVGNCLNFAWAFAGCPEFNSPMGEWDVSKGNTFSDMYNGSPLFNQDIGNWQTLSATIMDRMLKGAVAFNQDLSRWPVGKVTSHVDFDLGATNWVKPRPAFPVAK